MAEKPVPDWPDVMSQSGRKTWPCWPDPLAICNISEVVWDNEAAKLIEAMRQNGIERFTFSSGWSHAVETAWLFKEAGCTLEGLVEINSRYTGWNSDEHEKAHGYLFRVEG